MKKKFVAFTALLMIFSMLCSTFVYADGEQDKIKVKIVSSAESIYEDNTGCFEVAVDGLDDSSDAAYEWYVSLKSIIPDKSADVNGWYPMQDTYSWASGTDSQKLTLAIPKGFASKYMGDNSLVFRCKATIGDKNYYSDIIPLEILVNSYEDALAFDDEYQVPAIAGNRSVEEINPTDYYMIKFAAKALPERFSADCYTVKAGIRVDGELVVSSDTDYARLERGYEKGLYLVTEELYLYRDGIKVATARKEISLNVQESCEHYWQKAWDNATCAEVGTAYYTCIYCGAVKEEDSPATGSHDWHVIEDRKCSTSGEGRIVSVCSTCGEISIETVPHQFVTVRQENLTTGETFESTNCSNCGYKEGSTLHEFEGCDHDWVEESYTAPTCRENGKRVFSCSKCKESKTIEVFASSAYHVPSEWIDDSQGDCSVTGQRHIECTTCTETIVVEKLSADHRWELLEVTYPTCTDAGSIVWSCSRCGEKKTVSVKPEGHSIKHVDGIEGDCISETVKDHFECSQCGSVFADEAGKTALERSEVYIGCDNTKHIEDKVFAYNGNTHYSLCACFEKTDESRHKFSGGVCKVCGYVKGSMEETKFSFVDRLCEKLGMSEIKLLVILAAIFVVLLICTIVFLILFLRSGKKGKAKKKHIKEGHEDADLQEENIIDSLDIPDHAYDELGITDSETEDGVSLDENLSEEQFVDVSDAVMIDWGDDPFEPETESNSEPIENENSGFSDASDFDYSEDNNTPDIEITDFSDLEDL